MKANEIAPVVLIKNEEIWIERVLRPLLDVFGMAVVGDTGSTDRTAEICRSLAGVELIEMGELDLRRLGQARRDLGQRALSLGRSWIMQVDGDELYHAEALRLIASYSQPATGQLGFTCLLSLDQDEAGALWELDDLFSRAAVMPADVAWHGEYPFEAPAVFGNPAGFWYYPAVDGLRCHGLHLHRLPRSSADAAVVYRRQKQFQFSMQDKRVPRTRPFDAEGWW